MEHIQKVTDPSSANAINACLACREKKRKCDKRLPACARCISLKRSCNYNWSSPGQRGDNDSAPMRLLTWILQWGMDHPGTHSLEIDELYVNLVFEKLNEQAISLDRLLAEYFGNIHPWLPVVLEKSLHKQVAQLDHTPCAETALLILAIVLVMHRGTQDVPQTQFYNLFRGLFSFLQLRRGPSLPLIQSGLLLVLHEVGNSDSGAASLSIANIARLGYALRLNIDDLSEYSNRLAWVEGEERRRVWAGLYLLDRIVYQVDAGFKAPHAVTDLSDQFRLPVDDLTLEQFLDGVLQCIPQFPISAPVEIPLCYFAREIQSARLLGHVQNFQKSYDAESLLEKFTALDTALMQFAEQLFEQTPRGWAVLCGANATTLIAALILHRVRIDHSAQVACSDPSYSTRPSLLALSSFIHMVRDICCKFNSLGKEDKIDWVPLPAVICVGEAILAATHLKKIVGGEFKLDDRPLRQTLIYARKHWRLCECYLRRMD
ncbi:hypothetical protein AN8298.2 [Aspergillus nidulans FGSC A4]|uniref:Zn(II)2Cys6 transcription factor (Eurofung) n=1 Tax=Emericella nidulans (strain FGSC A4 / ATCC 38163 / CBS 112.46 / NRRL 194 / M139) TaxID=227321 RepID=Q5ATT2_EMENI|nr:hypothetical protein [Aspergillus nidulans FGSC A4]EAA66863.1 hypothetical protein AN8298.2 [Aspergillus nidulans FGSC A4]CBF80257.1 TPA: Putative Zn(II)2Cys6 transcription factor (Eurofung) [Aspergillus nidulans FGSC A4]|eukprot:XP_681567.1 hypothetical protein AN8298.2 [Aspergillus nidulans FGSC A4]